MKRIPSIALAAVCAASAFAAETVKTANGVLEGALSDQKSVRVFKGVPFAQPPVGDLRWKEPQPVKSWQGTRQAAQFGPRCMQRPIYSDMVFRSNGVSEDCLYLNIWTPAKTSGATLPVLVYFFGGGFQAGDGSEPRYDGESMAAKGIVAITVNYRLGVFGMMAHPELTKESPHHGSGNYGLMDQSAAVHWVKDNISAFGGDPNKLTIAGESAGSLSVSAQMASPLTRGLINGAIGESGSYLAGTLPIAPLANAEGDGVKFAEAAGAKSLAELRAMPANQLLELTAKQGIPRFSATLDGYFFPKLPSEIFEAGEQAHVPLLVGWNAAEAGANQVLRRDEPTAENFAKAVKGFYGDRADDVLKVYSAASPAEVSLAATDLASDRFIAYGTWRWSDMQSRTGGKPVYRYFFSRVRPGANGAVHASEIEYALGNLERNKEFKWTPDDFKISAAMQEYFANFIKTGDPNGKGLPEWPAVKPGEAAQVMRLDVNPHAEVETHRARYLLLQELDSKR